MGGHAPVDSLFHRFQLRQDFMIPEPNHLIPDTLQPRGSFGVLLHMYSMLSSIHLDDQFSFQTHKVHDIRPDRMLSAELMPVDLTAPYLSPQGTFSIRGALSQCPGVSVHPPSSPSPSGGEGISLHSFAKRANSVPPKGPAPVRARSALSFPHPSACSHPYLSHKRRPQPVRPRS